MPSSAGSAGIMPSNSADLLMVALFSMLWHASVTSGTGGFWDRVTSEGGEGGGGVQSWKFQGGWDWDRLAQLTHQISQSESHQISQSEGRPSKYQSLSNQSQSRITCSVSQSQITCSASQSRITCPVSSRGLGLGWVGATDPSDQSE